MTLAMNRMEALAASRADRAGRSKKEPRRIAAPRCRPGLPAQAELLDEGLVARGILAVQVIEQAAAAVDHLQQTRSEEHTSELQSLMRISYAVFCLKKKNNSTETQR